MKRVFFIYLKRQQTSESRSMSAELLPSPLSSCLSRLQASIALCCRAWPSTQLTYLHRTAHHMADYQRKRKSSRSRSRSPKPLPSIHQSGPNATISIKGSYNDVGRDLNITNITNLRGRLRIIKSKQNLMRWCITITTAHDSVRLLDFWSHAM